MLPREQAQVFRMRIYGINANVKNLLLCLWLSFFGGGEKIVDGLVLGSGVCDRGTKKVRALSRTWSFGNSNVVAEEEEPILLYFASIPGVNLWVSWMKRSK